MSFAALYPALSILLAVIFLGESLTVRQGAGVVLALAAMLLSRSCRQPSAALRRGAMMPPA